MGTPIDFDANSKIEGNESQVRMKRTIFLINFSERRMDCHAKTWISFWFQRRENFVGVYTLMHGMDPCQYGVNLFVASLIPSV